MYCASTTLLTPLSSVHGLVHPGIFRSPQVSKWLVAKDVHPFSDMVIGPRPHRIQLVALASYHPPSSSEFICRGPWMSQANLDPEIRRPAPIGLTEKPLVVNLHLLKWSIIEPVWFLNL